jgi:hypothetical protein
LHPNYSEKGFYSFSDFFSPDPFNHYQITSLTVKGYAAQNMPKNLFANLNPNNNFLTDIVLDAS